MLEGWKWMPDRLIDICKNGHPLPIIVFPVQKASKIKSHSDTTSVDAKCKASKWGGELQDSRSQPLLRG
jgi:hypothetical protein